MEHLAALFNPKLHNIIHRATGGYLTYQPMTASDFCIFALTTQLLRPHAHTRLNQMYVLRVQSLPRKKERAT